MLVTAYLQSSGCVLLYMGMGSRELQENCKETYVNFLVKLLLL